MDIPYYMLVAGVLFIWFIMSKKVIKDLIDIGKSDGHWAMLFFIILYIVIFMIISKTFESCFFY